MGTKHHFLANEIKTKLIDFLITKHKQPMLANELLFSKNKRRADLVLLKHNKIIAFEIKGDTDDTRRLLPQIKDYIQTFDEVNIVCTERLFRQISSIIPRSVGIIRFDGKFKNIRRATVNKKISKGNLVYFMKKNELLKRFSLGCSKQTTDEIRQKIVKNKSLIEIKKAALHTLQKKIAPTSKLFLRERGTATVNDDLLTLTGEIGPIR